MSVESVVGVVAADKLVATSEKPSNYLLVRGLTFLISEDQVSDIFRQFATVSRTTIIRDKNSGISKGIAVVEFPTIEYATYALQCTSQGDGVKLSGNTLKVVRA